MKWPVRRAPADPRRWCFGPTCGPLRPSAPRAVPATTQVGCGSIPTTGPGQAIAVWHVLQIVHWTRPVHPNNSTVISLVRRRLDDLYNASYFTVHAKHPASIPYLIPLRHTASPLPPAPHPAGLHLRPATVSRRFRHAPPAGTCKNRSHLLDRTPIRTLEGLSPRGRLQPPGLGHHRPRGGYPSGASPAPSDRAASGLSGAGRRAPSRHLPPPPDDDGGANPDIFGVLAFNGVAGSSLQRRISFGRFWENAASCWCG